MSTTSSISNSPVKPLIKWTGGKYREFKQFEYLIPLDFNNYYEPFFGGGGVFFNLQPKLKNFLNDKSRDLIAFYKILNNRKFKKEIYSYVDNWEKVRPLVNEVLWEFNAIFILYRKRALKHSEIKDIINEFTDKCLSNADWKYDINFYINLEQFKDTVKNNLFSKVTRIRKIEIKEGMLFEEEELKNHIETAFKSGFYIHFRNIMNQINSGLIANISKEKQAANWYFIRELCYGAMFRFNSSGEFNIPYGGIAYNKKNLREKAENLFSRETKSLLSQSKFHNLDFEDFLTKYKPKSGDFIFLDPPYDTNFSEYDNMSFSKKDQVRLANILFQQRAKWMLVIKKTEFIWHLYKHIGGIKIQLFKKNYTYNVRGRNNREVEHLIITNY